VNLLGGELLSLISYSFLEFPVPPFQSGIKLVSELWFLKSDLYALISIVLVIMAVRGRRGQTNPIAAPEAPPQGDPRDIKMEALRRQVQLLQQRLERYEASKHGASHHGSDVEVSSNDGDRVNPFHHARSHTSSDSTPPHPHNLRNHVF
jgi:hypothetical protein